MNIDVNQLQPRRTASPALKLLHETLFALLKIERRFDPFFRPALDAIFQEPLARGLQFLTNLWRDREILRLAEERKLPDEEAYLDSIISEMAAHMRQLYQPGSYERGGNTKTHGVVRGEFTVRGDLAAPYRHGVFTEPRTFPAWVRFSRPRSSPAGRYR